MFWFYNSFFPVVWVVFFVYWQVKALNPRTTRRFEPVVSPPSSSNRQTRAFSPILSGTENRRLEPHVR